MTDDSASQLNNFSVAILAGGQSRRLGRDKALLPVGGVPMLRRVIERAAQLEPRWINIITSRPHAYYAEALNGLKITPPLYFVRDTYPDVGALGALMTAISPRTMMSLAVACDMPFLNVPLLRHILAVQQQHMRSYPHQPIGILPRVAGILQPFHAIYHTVLTSYLHPFLDPDKRKITQALATIQQRENFFHFLDEPDWQPFDEHGYSFWNINTPEELAQAQQLAEAHPEL